MKPVKCKYPPRGWRCRRGYHMDGPCATVPSWWNLRGRRRMWWIYRDFWRR